MTQADYIDYFEGLARQHAAIRHSPEQPRFLVVKENDFSVVMKNIRTLRLPCVLLDQYYDTPERTGDNFRLRITGGITVLIALRQGDKSDVPRAEQEASRIALSFINRMYFDCTNRAGQLVAHRIKPSTEYEGEPFPTLDSLAAGWGYGFEWELPHSFALDPADWPEVG